MVVTLIPVPNHYAIKTCGFEHSKLHAFLTSTTGKGGAIRKSALRISSLEGPGEGEI
jgi:hypothetical protein